MLVIQCNEFKTHVFLKGLLRRLVLVSEVNLVSVNNKKPGKKILTAQDARTR